MARRRTWTDEDAQRLREMYEGDELATIESVALDTSRSTETVKRMLKHAGTKMRNVGPRKGVSNVVKHTTPPVKQVHPAGKVPRPRGVRTANRRTRGKR